MQGVHHTQAPDAATDVDVGSEQRTTTSASRFSARPTREDGEATRSPFVDKVACVPMLF